MSPSDTLRTFVGRSNTGLSYGLVDIWADEPGEPFSVCLDLYDRESDEILNTTGFFALDTMPKSSVLLVRAWMARWCMRRKWNLNYMCLMGDTVFLFSSIIRKVPKMKRYSYFMWRQITRRSGLGATMARAYLRTWERVSLYGRYGRFHCRLSGIGQNVIAVGAYATRICPVNVDGDTSYLAGNSLGELTSFSSVGPTLDNRMKPDITAPGLWVASSYNSFYLEGETGEGAKASQARYSTFNGHRYPWGI